MKRRHVNKVVFVFLWLIFLCIFVSCQQEKDIKSDVEKISKQPEKVQEKILKTEMVQWQDNIQKPERLETLYCKNNMVYLIGKRGNNYWLYLMDKKGKEQQEKKLKNLPDHLEQINQMVTDGQGNYAMILSKDSYTSKSKYFYTEYKEKKNKLEQIGIWEFEKPESITSISLDMGQAAVVYNMENVELYKKNDSGEFSNIDENRKHIITCRQSLGIMLDNGELWSIGNKVEKWSITENKRLLNIDFDGKIDGFIFFAHAEEENYSVYFTDNDAVYGCSKNGTIELLLEWFANDINGQDLTCFGGNGESFFAGNSEGVLYRIAENVSKGISDGKKVITIATTGDVSNVGFVL